MYKTILLESTIEKNKALFLILFSLSLSPTICFGVDNFQFMVGNGPTLSTIEEESTNSFGGPDIETGDGDTDSIRTTSTAAASTTSEASIRWSWSRVYSVLTAAPDDFDLTGPTTIDPTDLPTRLDIIEQVWLDIDDIGGADTSTSGQSGQSGQQPGAGIPRSSSHGSGQGTLGGNSFMSSDSGSTLHSTGMRRRGVQRSTDPAAALLSGANSFPSPTRTSSAGVPQDISVSRTSSSGSTISTAGTHTSDTVSTIADSGTTTAFQAPSWSEFISDRNNQILIAGIVGAITGIVLDSIYLKGKDTKWAKIGSAMLLQFGLIGINHGIQGLLYNNLLTKANPWTPIGVMATVAVVPALAGLGFAWYKSDAFSRNNWASKLVGIGAGIAIGAVAYYWLKGPVNTYVKATDAQRKTVENIVRNSASRFGLFAALPISVGGAVLAEVAKIDCDNNLGERVAKAAALAAFSQTVFHLGHGAMNLPENFNHAHFAGVKRIIPALIGGWGAIGIGEAFSDSATCLASDSTTPDLPLVGFDNSTDSTDSANSANSTNPTNPTMSTVFNNTTATNGISAPITPPPPPINPGVVPGMNITDSNNNGI